MTISVADGVNLEQVHYLRLSLVNRSGDGWLQAVNIYMDGSINYDPIYVSSKTSCNSAYIVIGPISYDRIPIAEVARASFDSQTDDLSLVYIDGSTTTLNFSELNSTTGKILVKTAQVSNSIMISGTYIDEQSSTFSHVFWQDMNGDYHNDAIVNFLGGAGTSWFIYNNTAFDGNHSNNIGINISFGK